MPIDPERAIGAGLPEQNFHWTSSDVLLYQLALGAGSDPVAPGELRYAYERDLRVLPTFGVIAPTLNVDEPPRVSYPGVEIDLANVLHGSQEITVHRPFPVEGKASARSRIVDVQDKGKAAVLVQETTTVDADGAELCTARSSIFARGEGGFGGHRGTSSRGEPPTGEPDAVLDTPTLPQQALLYRLCGDRNPLHADPEFAAQGGFSRPILHGLCTYGMVCKAITDATLDSDPARVASFGARFAGVVYPGESLRTRLWNTPEGIVAATSAPERDNAPVLADVTLTEFAGQP